MKKKDLALIAGVLLLALAAAGISALLGPKARNLGSGNWIVVTVNNQEYARIPLGGEERRLTVSPREGEENVLVITKDGAYMESANCRDQLCVAQGPVTAENYETRVNGSWIICLPHKVAVEFVVGDD